MLKIYGLNMNYISIKLSFLIPIFIYSEEFIIPSGTQLSNKKVIVNKNISREQINREIFHYFSVYDKNSTKDITNAVKKIHKITGEYLKNMKNDDGYINNSKVITTKNNNSTITNNIKKSNSKVTNSNIGVIIEKDIYNSNINNNVEIIHSTVDKSNLGVEILDEKKYKGKSLSIPKKVYINSKIKSKVYQKNSININTNNDVYIGN